MRLAAARSEIFYFDAAKKAAEAYLKGRRARRIKDSNGTTVTAQVTFETTLPAGVKSIGGFDLEISKADLAALVRAWEKNPQPTKKEILVKVNYLSCHASITADFGRGTAEFVYLEYLETANPDKAVA